MISLSFRFFATKLGGLEFQIPAKAALAVDLQSKFQEMHELLSDYEGKYTEEAVFNLAESLGIDMIKFQQDYGSEAIAKRLEEDISLAKQSDVSMIPGITINGFLYK